MLEFGLYVPRMEKYNILVIVELNLLVAQSSVQWTPSGGNLPVYEKKAAKRSQQLLAPAFTVCFERPWRRNRFSQRTGLEKRVSNHLRVTRVLHQVFIFFLVSLCRCFSRTKRTRRWRGVCERSRNSGTSEVKRARRQVCVVYRMSHSEGIPRGLHRGPGWTRGYGENTVSGSPGTWFRPRRRR